MNQNERKGNLLGILAVISFSLTLPFTKSLTGSLSFYEIGILRALIASSMALFIIIYKKESWPLKGDLLKFIIAGFGVVLGFPFLVALGMETVSSGHGGVLLASLPLSTAIFSYLFSKEKPSILFWHLSFLGFLVVSAFSISHTPLRDFSWSHGDTALFGAVLMGGLGYAQGGHLSKKYPSWKVICFALILTSPIVILISPFLIEFKILKLTTPKNWFTLLFLGLVNNLFAFFLWYRGLALGGVAKIGQLQLLQPFFTIFFSIILLNENFFWQDLIFCLLIVFIVFLTSKTKLNSEGSQ